MNFKSSSTPRTSLAFAAFAASLISLAGPAAAEANCPQGATCKCVPTTFTKCTVDAKGNQTCTQSKGEVCTVVSGPGSGKPALAQSTLSPSFPLLRR
ncbi:hypothetical protein GCM10027034_21510 [Ramlibacter solisilvae]